MQTKKKITLITGLFLAMMLSLTSLFAPASAYAQTGDAVVDSSGNVVLSADVVADDSQASSTTPGISQQSPQAPTLHTVADDKKSDSKSGDGGSNTVSFSSALSALQGIVTTFLLPLAIILSAWRILYIAVVCGIMGMDPLDMLDGEAQNGINAQEVKIAIMQHLTGFLKGLCWIGGIWIVFQICVSIAALLANTIQGAF